MWGIRTELQKSRQCLVVYKEKFPQILVVINHSEIFAAEFEKPCSNFYLLTYIFTLDKLKCHGQWKILINFLFRTGLSMIYRNSTGNSTEIMCLKNQPEIIEKEYVHEV